MTFVLMEKKQSTIQQTAAKIKTKIHNTSSYFKHSLKTNNKALAHALTAQKHRTRQLETETVCLQKDVQTLRFELAIQRHKNKQLFTIMKEFYNTSINCMAKAVDLISIEEVSENLDTHITEDASKKYEKGLNGFLPENTTCRSKCVEQEYVLATTVNTSAVNDPLVRLCSVENTEKLPSIEKDRTTPQNTLYDSEMEITVVDNVAEIVTVQTKPRKHGKDDQETFGECKKSCSVAERKNMSSTSETPVQLDNFNEIAVISPVETSEIQNKNTCTLNEEGSLQEHIETLYGATESVTARRKTHITSRNSKSNKQTHKPKNTESNADNRKTYVVSSSSMNCNNNNVDDYFKDLGVTHGGNESEEMSSDVNFSNDGHENENGTCIVKQPQNDSANQRKTYALPRKSRPRKSRKTRVSSFGLDQNALHTLESTKLIGIHTSGTVDTDAHVMELSVQAEMQSHSQTKGPSTVKNRGTYVIPSSHTFVYSDILNNAMDLQNDVLCGESAANALEGTNDSHGTFSVVTERPQTEQEVSSLLTNKSYIECPKANNDVNHLKSSSRLLSVGQSNPKNPQTEVKKKVKKKTVTAREKTKERRKGGNCCSTQNFDILPNELPCPVDGYNKQEYSTPSTAFHQSTEESQCSTFEGCYKDASRRQAGRASSIQSMNLDCSNGVGTVDDPGIDFIGVRSRPQNNEGYKSKGKETCEKSMILNRSSGDGLLSNGGSEIPIFHHNYANQSPPRKTEELRQKPKDTLSEERPPWESLDLDMSETCSDISAQTTEIYEEPGWNTMRLSSDKRATKREEDLTASVPGRTRRKALSVCYKEPTLNCKMRRGDKFSDTRFLSSPVFKDKMKKQKKTKE